MPERLNSALGDDDAHSPRPTGLARDRGGATAAAAEGWRVPIGLFAIRQLLQSDHARRTGGGAEGAGAVPERLDAVRCLLRRDAAALRPNVIRPNPQARTFR
jgi:hypothetical protein